jgi:uncharacterized membrane protein
MVELGPSVMLVWLLTVIVTLAVPVAIVWIIVVLIRKSSRGTSRRYDPAAEQLRYRYARGEIREAEFQQGMHLLGYQRVP